MKTINEIKNPEVLTYFIAHGETVVYGEVTPEQAMATGQPYLFQTVDREEWRNKLINEFNTDPDENNEIR